MKTIPLSETSFPEKTEVLYGNEKILERTLQTFSNIKEELNGCFDHTEVAMHVMLTFAILW